MFFLSEVYSTTTLHTSDLVCLFFFFPGFHGGVQEAVLSARELPRRPVLRGVSVLREGGGGEVLQSPEQDLQGESRVETGGMEGGAGEEKERRMDG